MKPSLEARTIAWMLKVSNFKKWVEKRSLEQIPAPDKAFPPSRIKRAFQVHLQSDHAHGIATLESKHKATKTHVLFFHGGAYIFKTTAGHWRLSENIIKRNFCRVTHIDYPLAPAHHYKETFNMVSSAYEKLITQYPSDNFIFMGDSAGGGLALAFAQKLIKETHPKLPAQIVLLSPWLDLSMANPAIKELEKSDHILTLKMLKHAGMKYSNGDKQDQYLLSPIYGELSNLPKTMVFYGTEELFYADCIKMKSLAGSISQNLIFREYPKMQHDWVLFPIPESNRVVGEICDFIDGEKENTPSGNENRFN